MIAALVEGVAQSVLPCSWVVTIPAVLVGMATSRPTVLASFAGSVALFIWTGVAGWLVVPVWVAGMALVAGAAGWWMRGLGPVEAAATGAGAAWAWRPCVGEELGRALNTAQQDPLAALPGLAAFILGVVFVGLVIGHVVRVVTRRTLETRRSRIGAGAIVLVGASMIVGLYSSVASVLARWSTSIWT